MAQEFEEVDVKVGNEILTLRVPKGTPDNVVMQKAQELAQAAPSVAPAQPVQAGLAPQLPRSGAVPEEPVQPRPNFQRGVRSTVESLPAPLRIGVEAAPSIIGTAIGAAGGALTSPVTGPVGPFVGGAAGGLIGEEIAQRTGLAPESTIGKVAAAAGPALGPLVTKGGKTLLGSISRVPGVSGAIQSIRVEEAAQKLIGYGADVLARARAIPGLAGRSAQQLETRLAKIGATVPGDTFNNTQRVMNDLVVEVGPYASLPEGRKVLALVDSLSDDLGIGKTPANIDLSDFLKVQRDIVKDRELPADLAKRLYNAMSDDVAALAKGKGATASAAKTAKLLVDRRTLESSVGQLDTLVSQNLRKLEQTGNLVVDLRAMSKSLLDLTNPKSAKYDADFTRALGKELPEIQRFIDKNAKYLSETMGPGGGLVVRAAGAKLFRTVAGAVTGGLLGGGGVGGALGGVLGGVAGAQGPELLTAALLTPTGRKGLDALIRVHKGRIPVQELVNIGQITTQGLTRGLPEGMVPIDTESLKPLLPEALRQRNGS